MAEEMIFRTPPIRCGERSIYPIIRVSDFSGAYGGYLSAAPVALIIEEKGAWYYALLEGEGDEDLRIILDKARQ